MTSFRMGSHGLLYSAGLAALMAPSMAWAQSSKAVDDNAGLRDIVVTAQKRGQNLQETPIAISAVPAEELELRGITEARDLSAIAPNVSVSGATTNATASVITIRGIPTPADETQGYDSPIGIYLDGVYLARSSASSFEVADIERVEVLRGPQGTLFGRNTTGGAINFITRLPSDDASLKVRAGYGNYNAIDFRAIFNTGDISGSGLKMSFGALHRERNGVVDNILQPKRRLDPGGNNTDSFRWAATFESGAVRLTNIFDYTSIVGVPFANQLAELGDGTYRPNVVIGGHTFAQVQPANVKGYLASATAMEPQCGPPLASVSRERLAAMCMEQAGKSTDELFGNMTRIEVELDSLTIRSTTAYREWKNKLEGSDLDGLGTIRGPVFTQATLFNSMPASLLGYIMPQANADYLSSLPVATIDHSLFQGGNNRRQRQFSQEIELVSESDGDFEWVLGAFYFNERGHEANPQDFLFVLDTNQAVFTDAAFGPLGAAFRAANPARYRAVKQATTLVYQSDGESVAVYGQGTYRPGGPSGALGITLGLRYTWDKKSINRSQNGATPFSGAEIALNQRSASFSEPTGNLTVDYRASDDVNLYARIARGYRSGGFNARQSTDVANNVALLPFGAERIWSYELGAKTEFFDRLRLNVAAFYNVYTDQQATIPIPITGGGSFGTQVVNAGKTNYAGIEIEGRLAVTDALTADWSFGYIHKTVKNFPGADITGTIRNIGEVIRLGNSPDYTANAGLTYSAPVGVGDMRLTARGGWSFVSSQTMFANPLAAPFVKSTSAGARSLFDAQLRLDRIPIGGLSGNGLSLMVWGKNITNNAYVSRGIDFGQLGYGSVIYGDPRTFGITAEIEF